LDLFTFTLPLRNRLFSADRSGYVEQPLTPLTKFRSGCHLHCPEFMEK
jgi:hypothetical protein